MKDTINKKPIEHSVIKWDSSLLEGLSEASGVTVDTIKKNVKELKAALELELPKRRLKMYVEDRERLGEGFTLESKTLNMNSSKNELRVGKLAKRGYKTVTIRKELHVILKTLAENDNCSIPVTIENLVQNRERNRRK